MYILRQRIASLIEPLLICALAAAWIVPLVGSTVARATRYGSPKPIVGLACIVGGAIVAAAVLPLRYFRVYAFERGGGLYRRIGVRTLRSIAPYGVMTQRLARRVSGAYEAGTLARTRVPLMGIAETRLNERVHVAAAIVAGSCSLQALGGGEVWRGGYLIVVGCVSMSCLCLQRYNRARLERLVGRLVGPPNDLLDRSGGSVFRIKPGAAKVE